MLSRSVRHVMLVFESEDVDSEPSIDCFDYDDSSINDAYQLGEILVDSAQDNDLGS